MQRIIKESNRMTKLIIGLTVSSGLIMALSLMTLAFGHTPALMSYGEVGQEDQTYYWHDGVLYINAVPSQGNGLFIAEPDIDKDYSIDQAIERFGIYEDTTAFNVKPSQYSDVIVLYELDDDLQFQITHIYEDSESGMMDYVQQMENSD